MKSYEEMAQSALGRIEAYKTAQEKRRKSALRMVTPAVGLCLAAVLGVGLWKSGLIKQTPVQTGENERNLSQSSTLSEQMSQSAQEDPQENPGQSSTPQKAEEIEQTKPYHHTKDDFCIPLDIAITEWQGKSVSIRLSDWLKNHNGDEKVSLRATPAIDWSYEFNGKRLEEYYKAMAEESILPEIYAQLLKDGEALKYGEALYLSGTPEGERWAKELYEERVRFYGEKILNRYLVDGRFLKEKLEQDRIAAANRKDAANAYQRALDGYLTNLAVSVGGEVIPEGGRILLHLTKEEFAAFNTRDISAWFFDLDLADNEAPGDQASAAH